MERVLKIWWETKRETDMKADINDPRDKRERYEKRNKRNGRNIGKNG